jgi:hypothetical protein
LGKVFVVQHEPHLISGVEENVLFSRILREKFDKNWQYQMPTREITK